MPVTPTSSYRPHNPGHDYYAPGIYLITLVTRGRCAHFGRLNDDVHAPGVVLSAVGEAVMEEWAKIPAFELQKEHHVRLHGAVCMPDHFHGVIEVVAPMDRSLGQVIWGFKVACTKRWRAMQPAQPGQPRTAAHMAGMTDHVAGTAGNMAGMADHVVAGTAGNMAGMEGQQQGQSQYQPSLADAVVPTLASLPDLHNMSRKQRAQYYAAHPEAQQPLFDDNYDDTICLTDPKTGQYDPRHYQAMVSYVQDNPRRAIIRRLNPQFMEHRQHIQIAGQDYAAFGNLFLLRWARKVQVFCHRRSPDGRCRYVDTEAFREDCRRWKAQVMEGATVLVTPGISPGELLIKNRCIELGYPLIHLQKEPIPPFKKPEKSRFDACAAGRLLILSPWHPDKLGDYNGVPSQTEYSIFHNMNDLAAKICEWQGEMKWIGKA